MLVALQIILEATARAAAGAHNLLVTNAHTRTVTQVTLFDADNACCCAANVAFSDAKYTSMR